jgi:hypothetical protein
MALALGDLVDLVESVAVDLVDHETAAMLSPFASKASSAA